MYLSIPMQGFHIVQQLCLFDFGDIFLYDYTIDRILVIGGNEFTRGMNSGTITLLNYTNVSKMTETETKGEREKYANHPFYLSTHSPCKPPVENLPYDQFTHYRTCICSWRDTGDIHVTLD